MKLPERWRLCIEVQVEYVEKLLLLFEEKQILIHKIYKNKVRFIFEQVSYFYEVLFKKITVAHLLKTSHAFWET
jgi:hypothetical protein